MTEHRLNNQDDALQKRVEELEAESMKTLEYNSYRMMWKLMPHRLRESLLKQLKTVDGGELAAMIIAADSETELAKGERHE